MINSKVEPAIQTQGYFRYGFGSFMPHSPKKQPQQQQQQQPPGASREQHDETALGPGTIHHTRYPGIHRETISLPEIHLSKLKERPPRKQTHSLKSDDEPASATCINSDFYNDGIKKKQSLPSLATSSILPKPMGKVFQASSWWEWSRKDYRIKETKFHDRLSNAEHVLYVGDDAAGNLRFAVHLILCTYIVRHQSLS